MPDSSCFKKDYPGLDTSSDKRLAAFFRSYLDGTRERFFTIPYEVAENVYKLPGESDGEACDRIVSGTLVSVGVPGHFADTKSVDWKSNPTYNGYREWTWQLSRHNDIKLLAHEYNLTHKKEYATAAENLLVSWIDTCPAPSLDVIGYLTDCWRTIECGLRMGANWPYIIYTFYREFSDETLVKILDSVYQHALQLKCRSTRGNWLLMEMNGLLHISILYPFFKDAAEWGEYATSRMCQEAEKQFYPDGLQYELTTCYHEVSINNYQRMMELMKAFSVPVPEQLYSILATAVEGDIKLMMPDGGLPDINDGITNQVKPLLEPKARFFDSPEIRYVLTDGKEGSLPSYTSTAFPYSGFAVFRSSWSEDAVYGLFDSAPFGRGHQHEDKLSIQIANGRKRVVTEAGCYAYDESDMRHFSLSSFAHNVLIVDGMGQNRRKSYDWQDDEIRKLSDLEWKSSESVDYASGTYSGPYGDEEKKPAVWKRSVSFIKQSPLFSRPCFLIIDEITSADGEEHEYTLLWNVDSKRLSVTAESASYEDVDFSFTPGGDLSVVRGRMHPVQGFIATGREQGMYKAVDTLEYRLIARDVKVATLVSFGEGVPGIRRSADGFVICNNGKELNSGLVTG